MKLQHNFNFFRTLMTSGLASVSCAVLASSLTLFAPSAAVAATLIDNNNNGVIDGVSGLEVGDSLFDVEFFGGLPDGFDFLSRDDAVIAQRALRLFLEENLLDFDIEDDQADSAFLDGIPGAFFDETRLVFWVGDDVWVGVFQDSRSGGVSGGFSIAGLQFGGSAGLFDPSNDRGVPLVARFSSRAAAAETPEPSLILGLITLSGLMLGSKTKTKG